MSVRSTLGASHDAHGSLKNVPGDVREIVGRAGPTSTTIWSDCCVDPPGNAADQSIAVTDSTCGPAGTPAVLQSISYWNCPVGVLSQVAAFG